MHDPTAIIDLGIATWTLAIALTVARGAFSRHMRTRVARINRIR